MFKGLWAWGLGSTRVAKLCGFGSAGAAWGGLRLEIEVLLRVVLRPDFRLASDRQAVFITCYMAACRSVDAGLSVMKIQGLNPTLTPLHPKPLAPHAEAQNLVRIVPISHCSFPYRACTPEYKESSPPLMLYIVTRARPHE